MKHIKLMQHENEILFNKARVKYVNEYPNRKATDELVIKEVLEKYLSG